MTCEVKVVTGEALDAVLDEVAALRIAVFRDWPYCYDGDLDYERRYLAVYRDNPEAIVVLAIDPESGQVVGASTGSPLAVHAEDFSAAFAGTGIDLNSVFYCAESVLLPRYRGQGLGHAFFDHREAHARALGFTHSAFCAVIREPKAAGESVLEAFWRRRGYAMLDGVVTTFHWRDVGDDEETPKSLQFWMRSLT
jgi:GNAT superfamily N-acetyltransferase